MAIEMTKVDKEDEFSMREYIEAFEDLDSLGEGLNKLGVSTYVGITYMKHKLTEQLAKDLKYFGCPEGLAKEIAVNFADIWDYGMG